LINSQAACLQRFIAGKRLLLIAARVDWAESPDLSCSKGDLKKNRKSLSSKQFRGLTPVFKIVE
jgi:hypothetical protein